jgi:hypothetical protein
MDDTAASPLLNPSTPERSPEPGHLPRWLSPLAFAVGGILTALILAAAFQGGTFDASANTHPAPIAAVAPAPDPRLDRLLSLLESERDCDALCLADLRSKADKSAALEQALGRLQESVSAAEQRAAASEAEKAGLADQASRKTTELETDYKQQIAALEKRLADAESRLQAARQDRTLRKPAATRPVPAAATTVASPPPRSQPQPQTSPPASPPKWTVLGMTASSVVVSTANHRVVALAAGETLDGIQVRKIDLDRGTVETSAGTFSSPQ